jgi:DNA-binding MarR family transcriptional regulator
MLIMLPTNEFTQVLREWSGVFMRRSGRDFRGFMEETGLSFSHLNILMRLFHGGKCGVSEIGERMGISNAAASQSIDRLVNLGLIERSEDPKDRRAKQLTLTAKGLALVEGAIEARSKWIESLTEALTPEQQSMIVSALTLLTEAARKTED